jgi:hypothetical protein
MAEEAANHLEGRKLREEELGPKIPSEGMLQ